MTILPDLTEEQLNGLSSQGEAKVYRSLRDHLGGDYLVLFQVGWILRREKDRARDGETDFLICHPTHGYLCVIRRYLRVDKDRFESKLQSSLLSVSLWMSASRVGGQIVDQVL